MQLAISLSFCGRRKTIMQLSRDRGGERRSSNLMQDEMLPSLLVPEHTCYESAGLVQTSWDQHTRLERMMTAKRGTRSR